MTARPARAGARPAPATRPATSPALPALPALPVLAAAAAALSAAGLLYEVALTSLFSVLLQYHYAFVAISLALGGYGLGAAFVRRPAPALPGSLAAAGAVTMAAAVWLLAALGSSLGALGAALALVPFACLGAAMAALFALAPPQVGWLYAADLAGAAAGCLGAVALLDAVGGLSGALLAAALAALAALLLALAGPPLPDRRRLLAAALTALLLAAPGLAGVQGLRLDPAGAPPDKTMLRVLGDPGQGARIVATRWDSFARNDLVATADPDQMLLFINGGAGSYMLRWNSGPQQLIGLQQSLEYLPVALSRPHRALVIGPGGGRDVALALLGGTDQVDAVEIDPGLVDLVRRYGDYNGHILDRPGVALHVDDGRHFAARAQGGYDLILLNLVYTQVAEARSYALTENYIFTREAFARYLDLLAPGGTLAVVSHSALEASRAALTGIDALARTGLDTPQATQRVALLMTPDPDPTRRTSLVLVRREPITGALAEALIGAALALHLQPLHVPGLAESVFRPLSGGEQDVAAYVRGGDYDLAPVADARPFFFLLDRGLPGPLAALLILAAVLLAAVVLRFAARGPGRLLRTGPAALYFGLLGAGFMLLELPLMQQAILLLGSPVQALAVTTAALLTGAAAGSAASRLAARHGRSLTLALPAALAVAALALALNLILPALQPALLRAPALGRLLAFAALLLPLGAAAGVCFPAALAVTPAGDVPLCYAMGGAAAVLGAAAAMAAAVFWGFPWVLNLAAACYIGAGATAPHLTARA